MDIETPILIEDQVIQAEEIVTAHNRATTALLERLMKVHYQTAVALLEELEKRRVVGPETGRLHERPVYKTTSE